MSLFAIILALAAATSTAPGDSAMRVEIPPLQIIAAPIYSDPAPLWESSCGLIDDREPAPAVRGDAYYSAGPGATDDCDPDMLQQTSVELDPAEQRAFEEAIDITRFPR